MLDKVLFYIVVILCLPIVLFGFSFVFLFMPFALSATIAGETVREYRCVDNVLQERTTYWGVSILPYKTVDGDPAGACD